MLVVYLTFASEYTLYISLNIKENKDEKSILLL